MARRFFGFRFIHKKIENKLLQFARIPKKYFEALYVECSTQIECYTIDLIESEERTVRRELFDLMKEGEVDTKIELNKFQLFERLNSLNSMGKEIRLLMQEEREEIKEDTLERLINILKDVSETGEILYEAVKALYDKYDKALAKVEDLRVKAQKILDGLYDFRFRVDGRHEYAFEKPEVLIGNSIRDTLQEMLYCGDKIEQIIAKFSFNHQGLKEEIDIDESNELEIEKEK